MIFCIRPSTASLSLSELSSAAKLFKISPLLLELSNCSLLLPLFVVIYDKIINSVVSVLRSGYLYKRKSLNFTPILTFSRDREIKYS